jgi:hypothetical protein
MIKTSKKSKRPLLKIIDNIYEFIENAGGEIYVSNLRKVVSNPKNALAIIENIQDRPYLYFKEQTSTENTSTEEKSLSNENEEKKKRKYITIKLSSHKRNPKTRFLQLEEIIEYLEVKYEQSNTEKFTKADIEVVLTRTLDALKMISNRVRVPTSYLL